MQQGRQQAISTDLGLTQARASAFSELPAHLEWTWHPDGHCDCVNAEWVAYTGVPAVELLGEGWLAQVHAEDRPRVRDAWCSGVVRGVPFDVEFRIRRFGGTHRWFRTRAVPLKDVSGKTSKWYASTTDVDEDKCAKEALLASEACFRSAIARSPIPMLIHDENDQILAMSAGWTKLSGYTVEEVPTVSLWALRAFGGSRAFTREFVDRIFETDRTVSDGECTIRTKLGEERIWEISTSPLLDPGNTPRLLLSTAIDLTDRTRAARAIQRSNAELERQAHERTAQLRVLTAESEALSYAVAHDVRAPLRAVNGFAQILLDGFSQALDAKGKDCIREIQSNAQRLAQLIDGMMELSRLTRCAMRPERVDLTALAHSILRDLSASQRDRAIKVSVDSELALEMDPELARVLLRNLLDNAWKFTGRVPDASIHVGETVVGGHLTFFVRDNGAGFDMRYAAELFKPFRRLHSTSEYPGTGVGLAAAERIVRRHGGRIWADARPNEGATFQFTFGQTADAQARCG